MAVKAIPARVVRVTMVTVCKKNMKTKVRIFYLPSPVRVPNHWPPPLGLRPCSYTFHHNDLIRRPRPSYQGSLIWLSGTSMGFWFGWHFKKHFLNGSGIFPFPLLLRLNSSSPSPLGDEFPSWWPCPVKDKVVFRAKTSFLPMVLSAFHLNQDVVLKPSLTEGLIRRLSLSIVYKG